MARRAADDENLARDRRFPRQRQDLGDAGEGEAPGREPRGIRINALFGEGSQFHETHGFYIDGVDENTAILPVDWRTRAIVRRVDVGSRVVTAVVSKLARLDEKDREFIESFHAVRPLDPEVIEKRTRSSAMDGAVADRAVAYIRALTRGRDHDGEGKRSRRKR